MPTAPPVTEIKTASVKLQGYVPAGGTHRLADADLSDTGTDGGEHDVHDADSAHDQGDGGEQAQDNGEGAAVFALTGRTWVRLPIW